MPRRDGTGPVGRGSMRGKGLGVCSGINARSLNRGNGNYKLCEEGQQVYGCGRCRKRRFKETLEEFEENKQ